MLDANKYAVLPQQSFTSSDSISVDKAKNASTNQDQFQVSQAVVSSDSIGNLSAQAAIISKIIGVIEIYKNLSISAGDSVKFLEQYGYFPVLIGNDNKPVPLFMLVEILDEMVDYDAVLKELPTVSFSQIHNAINFLRKISALNLHGRDIDDLEEYLDEENHNLIEELKNGLADKEIKRVLYHDK